MVKVGNHCSLLSCLVYVPPDGAILCQTTNPETLNPKTLLECTACGGGYGHLHYLRFLTRELTKPFGLGPLPRPRFRKQQLTLGLWT